MASFDDDVVQEALKHERELGLPEGFLNRLREEDDWSFIVKGHAFLEATLTRALTETVGTPALENVFARLEMSDNKKGKLAFARAIGMLDKKEATVIKRFSELRNHLLHDVRNVSFSLADYFKRFDQPGKRQFVRSVSFANSVDQSNDKLDAFIERMGDNVKEDLWTSIAFLAAILSLQIERQRLKRKTDQTKDKLLAAAFPDSPPLRGFLAQLEDRVQEPTDEQD